MGITPLDIKQQEFKVNFMKGFDKDEVKSFLEMVAGEYENLRRENLKLKADLTDYRAKFTDLKDRESVIREAMVTTHKASEDIKINAKKEAEIILGEAEIAAERIINEAQNRLMRIIDDINDLKRQKTELMVSIKSIVDMHNGVLESMKESDRSEINQKMELMRSAPKKVGEQGMTFPLAVIVVFAAILVNLTLFSYLSDLTGENLVRQSFRKRIYLTFIFATLAYLLVAGINYAGIIKLHVEFEDPYDHGKLWFLNLGELLSFATIYGGALVGLLLSFPLAKVAERFHRSLGFIAFGVAALDTVLLMAFFYL